MPRWLLLFALLSAGCAPIRHSRENQVLDHARASLGEALDEDDWMGRGRGRRLKVDASAITPEMARTVNDSTLVEELWIETKAPPAVADVLALQFEERKEHKPSYQGRTWQVWRRKNIPELDWVDRTFGVTLTGTQ